MRRLLHPLLNALAPLTLAATLACAADKARFYDEVLAVDASSITVYRSPTKEAKFAVSSSTKVFVDNKLARIEDVKPGMKATVYRKPDTGEAASISVRTVKTGR